MIEWMILLAGAVNRIIEPLKLGIIAPLQTRFKFSNDVYAALVLALSLVLGVVAAVVGAANALALVPGTVYTARIPDWVGVLAAGLLIGLGTNLLHEVGEFLGTLRRPTVQSTATLISSEPLTVTLASTNAGEIQASAALPEAGRG